MALNAASDIFVLVTCRIGQNSNSTTTHTQSIKAPCCLGDEDVTDIQDAERIKYKNISGTHSLPNETEGLYRFGERGCEQAFPSALITIKNVLDDCRRAFGFRSIAQLVQALALSRWLLTL
ncbi:hypothetical protein [Tateyamaria sp.]|uniref:hypothetical protein n=1 Tax=Tateyamaria sp. TaxID=1929288 RepID=UPI00329BC573